MSLTHCIVFSFSAGQEIFNTALSSHYQDNLEERDLTHPNEICYATINHGLTEPPPMINSNHETEYALICMPAKKVTFTGHQDNEYDYVLIS